MNQFEYDNQVKKLNQAAARYYRGEDSGMTDFEFDQAIEDLRKVEESGIINISKDSPTRRVNGGNLATDKIPHATPMLSLKDVFTFDDLKAWVASKPGSFTVEPKIDGLSVEFFYENYNFVRALTRGDGIQGEDVTGVARNISDLPIKISVKDLVVRGEVYMTKEAFRVYTETVGKAANARNLAVGLLRRKDDLSGGKFLSVFMFRIHRLIYRQSDQVTHGSLDTQWKQMKFLRSLGFNTVSCEECRTWSDVENAINRIHKLRPDLICGIDGAVVKMNAIESQRNEGDNGHVPNWAVAYKYPPEEQSTKVIGITYQLGKTGKLTPVAELEPVKVAGSTVSRCTLHNRKRMEELDIRIGDRVFIHKAGDIIPAISRAEHTEDSQDFTYPTTCPVCGEPLDGERCVNKTCKNILEVKVQHWAGKGGVDIKGVASSVIQGLLDKGIIETVPDLYKLMPADLYRLPKMGPTKVRKIMSAIVESKNRTFSQVLCGLCIDGLGTAAATRLADDFKTWDALLEATENDLYQSIRNVAASNIYSELHSDFYQKIIERLRVIYAF